MKFNLWTDYGALNSKPVFNAFSAGATVLGHDIGFNNHDGDVNVIWSVLFNGRMARNRMVWERSVAESKPVVVLEVGGIKRGTTWKVGINGINRDAIFGNNNSVPGRAKKLGLTLKPWRQEGKYILICGQHNKSLQWNNMPSMSKWFMDTIDTVKEFTDRPIIIRPHPRCPLPHLELEYKNVSRQDPKQLPGTYDDFDMGFNNIWATISYSSNPGIHSIINGIPAFVGPSSLAYPVANDIADLKEIETPHMGARKSWLEDYAWTEYTIEEIAKGIPINRLTSLLF